jgi:hypothetical protein
MSDFSSSSAFEKKTLVGVWSIPGQRRKCYGTLHFELDGEQKLSIIGDLGDFDYSHFSRLPEFDVIHGACREDGQIKCVTIFDAKYSRRSTPRPYGDMLSESDITFQDVWIGAGFYDKREDIVFSSFSFGLNNIEMWHNTSNFFSRNYDSKKNSISTEMTIPDPIDFFSDDKVTISVAYWNQESGFGAGQTESTIRCIPYISISAKKGNMPYYGEEESFEFYFLMIFQLFQLLFLGQTFFFCMYGHISLSTSRKKTIPLLFREELLFARDITLKQRTKFFLPDNVLFPYQSIKDNLPNLISNFQRYYKKLRVVLDSAISSICATSHGMNSLPLLLFSMEGLQQIFYHSLGEGTSEENAVEYSSFNSMRDQIVQCCKTKEQKSFVKREISWKKSFRDRLFAILLDQKEVFSFLDDDMCSSLADDLKKIRNDAAHSDEREFFQKLPPLYRGQLIFVQFLHIAIILKFCGLSSAVIKSRFDNHLIFPFREMSAILRSHYGSTKAE